MSDYYNSIIFSWTQHLRIWIWFNINWDYSYRFLSFCFFPLSVLLILWKHLQGLSFNAMMRLLFWVINMKVFRLLSVHWEKFAFAAWEGFRNIFNILTNLIYLISESLKLIYLYCRYWFSLFLKLINYLI